MSKEVYRSNFRALPGALYRRGAESGPPRGQRPERCLTLPPRGMPGGVPRPSIYMYPVAATEVPPWRVKSDKRQYLTGHLPVVREVDFARRRRTPARRVPTRRKRRGPQIGPLLCPGRPIVLSARMARIARPRGGSAGRRRTLAPPGSSCGPSSGHSQTGGRRVIAANSVAGLAARRSRS
jgi:hypothetical protein